MIRAGTAARRILNRRLLDGMTTDWTAAPRCRLRGKTVADAASRAQEPPLAYLGKTNAWASRLPVSLRIGRLARRPLNAAPLRRHIEHDAPRVRGKAVTAISAANIDMADIIKSDDMNEAARCAAGAAIMGGQYHQRILRCAFARCSARHPAGAPWRWYSSIYRPNTACLALFCRAVFAIFARAHLTGRAPHIAASRWRAAAHGAQAIWRK